LVLTAFITFELKLVICPLNNMQFSESRHFGAFVGVTEYIPESLRNFKGASKILHLFSSIKALKHFAVHLRSPESMY
jgi:hypothetical protein